jgi:hypothetical protein
VSVGIEVLFLASLCSRVYRKEVVFAKTGGVFFRDVQVLGYFFGATDGRAKAEQECEGDFSCRYP